jgi:hypothetical protein
MSKPAKPRPAAGPAAGQHAAAAAHHDVDDRLDRLVEEHGNSKAYAIDKWLLPRT